MANARAGASDFTTAEVEKLHEIGLNKEHWNPLSRAAAARAESTLVAARDSCVQQALEAAQWEFREREITKITTDFQGEQEHRGEIGEQIARLETEGETLSRNLFAVGIAHGEAASLKHEGGTVREFDTSILPDAVWNELGEMKSKMLAVELAHAPERGPEVAHEAEFEVGESGHENGPEL
jgi:hypothetical protein